jgi:hypothetical protein
MLEASSYVEPIYMGLAGRLTSVGFRHREDALRRRIWLKTEKAKLCEGMYINAKMGTPPNLKLRKSFHTAEEASSGASPDRVPFRTGNIKYHC